MEAIRRFVASDAAPRRALLFFAGTLLLIGGLLAMHTLAAAHDMGPMSNASSAMVVPASGHHDAPHDGMDEGRSGVAAPMPDHSMLMVTCILALLAGVIVVVAPAALAWLGGMLTLLEQRIQMVLGSRPLPRPPSLHVLSISRT